ncbi:MAG: molecular chaperone HtpG [Clostridia bacterium]|nr:molecular chaperone HtpG [Clostridia bacterium]
MSSEELKNETVKKGGISVETAHIFPVIKKWLYSDKDIFIREIVSNASDAVVKLKRLNSLGEISVPEGERFRVTVELDKTAGTITVTDNGIGMTEEELEKYLCSIALSGALDFIQKYEDGKADAGNGIIGHFGLGFYSSFMVSDTVEVDTLSCRGGKAVHWTCVDAGDYEISESDRTERGTSVIMHISEDGREYLDEGKIRSVLDKYCSFMPVDIYFISDEDSEKDYVLADPAAPKEEESSDDAAEGEKKDGPVVIRPVNDTVPLWNRPQSEISDEEYNTFYHKLFNDYDDPLFHIHINADYPLNFKGILYFPKIRTETQSLEGEVKLFYNQVFVADNIKEVLPDYLLMLRGALDCPELPLNVSRSYLQDSAYVKRIAQFIVKKVADKLNSLAMNDREKYEKVYDDIRIFIEYACLREKKFYDRVKDSLLLKLTDGSFKTFDEYLKDAAGDREEKSADENADASADEKKPEGTVYYATDTAMQTQYIRLLNDAGIKVAVFDLMLDSQYLTSIEQNRQGIHFVRVDADISDALKSADGKKADEDMLKKLGELFKKVSGSEKLRVSAEELKNAEVPAVLIIGEQQRRFEDMMKLYSAPGEKLPDMPIDATLTLNTACPVFGRLCGLAESDDTEKTESFAAFVYRLALLAQKKLTAAEMTAFLSDSYRLLGLF